MPPACVDPNCSNQQLLEGEIFDLFEAEFLGLGVVHSCDFRCRDSPQSVLTRQQTAPKLKINHSLYMLFCL